MRIVVKVGTSTLAHSTGRMNIRRVEALCKVLSDVKNAGHEVILVSSGAIGMGVGKLSLSRRPADIPTKQAAAAVGQCELMYTYDRLFSEYNHTVAQLLVTGSDVEDETRRAHFHNTLYRLLELGALPVINENDTIATDEIVIGDNDTLSAIVAATVQADLLILLSDIEGLYTADPRSDAGARLIPVVRAITPEIEALAGGNGTSLGTGGMVTKLRAARIAASAGIDMVILTTPPVFRPEMFKYATEKGVHSFLEKPIAIDPKGYRSVMATAKQAQAKGLSVVVGTQRHHERRYVEANKQIQAGLIGEITGGNVYWNQGMLWYRQREEGWTDMEWNIRDWVNWKWLSGDHIIEQHVHNIDVFLWMSGLKPVSATAFGSRQRRVTGDQYDFFSTDFTMENGIHMHSMCRQIDGCSSKVSEFIQGTKGSWDSETNEIKDLEGNVIWKFDEEAVRKEFQQFDPYTLEHVDWVNHIRKGTAHEEATDNAISCMAGIMGREAAYTGQTVTWDEMTQSPQDFLPEKLELGPLDLASMTVPVPGK